MREFCESTDVLHDNVSSLKYPDDDRIDCFGGCESRSDRRVFVANGKRMRADVTQLLSDINFRVCMRQAVMSGHNEKESRLVSDRREEKDASGKNRDQVYVR